MDSRGSTPSPPPPTEPAPILPPPIPARQNKPAPTTESQNKDDIFNNEVELDEDEASQQMTQSYSEISFRSNPSPDDDSPDAFPFGGRLKLRPVTLTCDKNKAHAKPLMPLNLEGTVRIEGNVTHFVTEDLENKLRLSSPGSKKGDNSSVSSGSKSGTPGSLYRQLLVPQIGQLDAGLINDLECEAHRMATSIDNLIENLSGILHSISSITADNVDVYKNAVSKMSDAMDVNIKSMYTMMAKAEEVTQSMKVVEENAARIKEIKSLVNMLETFM